VRYAVTLPPPYFVRTVTDSARPFRCASFGVYQRIEGGSVSSRAYVVVETTAYALGGKYEPTGRQAYLLAKHVIAIAELMP